MPPNHLRSDAERWMRRVTVKYEFYDPDLHQKKIKRKEKKYNVSFHKNLMNFVPGRSVIRTGLKTVVRRILVHRFMIHRAPIRWDWKMKRFLKMVCVLTNRANEIYLSDLDFGPFLDALVSRQKMTTCLGCLLNFYRLFVPVNLYQWVINCDTFFIFPWDFSYHFNLLHAQASYTIMPLF